MKFLVFACLLAAVGCRAEVDLTTSYVQELRAEIALADHLVLSTPPEFGGATRSINDRAEIRTIAKLLPKAAVVMPSRGAETSIDYATIAVYEARDSKLPSVEFTVTPDDCKFLFNNTSYEFETPDASLYNAIMKATAPRE